MDKPIRAEVTSDEDSYLEFRIQCECCEIAQEMMSEVTEKAEERHGDHFRTKAFVMGGTMIVGVVIYTSDHARRRFVSLMAWVQKQPLVNNVNYGGVVSISTRERLNLPETARGVYFGT